VVVGGLKLFGVGFVSSIGTLSVSNGIWAIRKVLKPEIYQKPTNKRSPVIKTALVYGSFLGLSANLRYQVRLMDSQLVYKDLFGKIALLCVTLIF
jgi:hypothetical protein